METKRQETAKHTPGPWEADKSRFRHDNSIPIKYKDGFVASALDFNKYDRDSEVEANAQLIAAAPDLLEACRKALNLLWAKGANRTGEQYPDKASVHAMLTHTEKVLFGYLDQAIARATGKGE